MKLPPKEVKSKKRNKLVYGVGVNDADYVVQVKRWIDGKHTLIWVCPFYQTWMSMLRRCYSEKFHQTNPTYIDCSVCDEWLLFSNFKKWMEKQDWEGKQLDKDFLKLGNRNYSPDTCIFVDHVINSFITDGGSRRGEYMIGVSLHKPTGALHVRCNNPFTREYEHLGYFTDELEAHLAWKARKHELACMLAESEYCNDPRLAQALKTRYL